jgi:hypothetical protein
LQDGDWIVQAFGDSADTFDDQRVFLVFAVRKIESRDIHASAHQLFELLFAARGRANGTDNLCTTHDDKSLKNNCRESSLSLATLPKSQTAPSSFN